MRIDFRPGRPRPIVIDGQGYSMAEAARIEAEIHHARCRALVFEYVHEHHPEPVERADLIKALSDPETVARLSERIDARHAVALAPVKS